MIVLNGSGSAMVAKLGVSEALSTDVNVTNQKPTDWGDLKYLINFRDWNVDFGVLLLSLLLAIIWFTFLTYYYSRLIAFTLSKFLNRFCRGSHFHLGSFSVSILSGKVMFRELAYVTEDYSFRIHDGWMVFRYWKWYKSVALGQDFSHSDPRLIFQANGVELHVYNQIEKYRHLDRLFNLGMFPTDETSDLLPEKEASKEPVQESKTRKRNELWRSLFPVIRFEISTGRLVFGNKHLPNTLAIRFENMSGDYTTKAPSNLEDLFMHSCKGSCENFRVALVKSLGYNGTYEEPPRTMGEGFVVLQSASLEFYYFQDELGTVKDFDHQPQDQAVPVWGTHFRLGKNTVISYGPWADKQRDVLYKLFFPPDYQVAQITSMPQRGQKRVFLNFDLRVMTLNEGTMDILFLRKDDLNAIHVAMTQGSYVEVNVPWTISPDGFRSKVKGLLMHVELASSLEYRQVADCETLEFCVDMIYPRNWNQLQVWNYDFIVSKSSLWIVYAIKDFIQDLMEECSDPHPPDVYKFVPYIWNFTLTFRDFELMVMINEFNWIDTSSQNDENCAAGVRGKELVIEFALNFDTFLPATLTPEFLFTARTLELLLKIPSQHTHSHILNSLHSSVPEIIARKSQKFHPRKFWESVIVGNDWLLVWQTSGASFSLKYHYHPSPHLHKFNVPREHLQALGIKDHAGTLNYDRSGMDPDLFEVGFELNPSTLFFTTAIVKYLLIFKQNYLGECQQFSEISTFKRQTVEKPFGKVSDVNFDERAFRPLSVTVSILLTNVEAYGLMHRNLEEEVSPPVVLIEQLVFEMKKRHYETELQLSLSPVTLFFNGNTPTDCGSLSLSGFQMRGHAMFSENGLPLDSPTVEYAWLTELILGQLSGKLSPKHCVQLARFLDTCLFLLINKEEDITCPLSMDLCQHMQPRTLCFFSMQEGTLCPTESDLKYKFIRVSVDSVELCIVEENSVIQLTTEHLRLGTCTFHQYQGKEGVTCSIPEVNISQFVQAQPNQHRKKRWSPSDLIPDDSATDRFRSPFTPEKSMEWLRCGHATLKDTSFVVALPLLSKERFEHQRNFLLLHDEKFHRLAFLWAKTPTGPEEIQNFLCGCRGGCEFFGSNVNGKGFFGVNRKELAVVTIAPSRNVNPGFGQSILRDGEETFFNLDAPASEQPSWSKLKFSSADDDEFYPAEQDFPEDFVTPKTLSPAEQDDDSDVFSYKSTHSTNEEPTVNLYGQVNRPVLTSPMLMAGYEKSLDHYVLSTQEQFPNRNRFERIRLGLNNVKMLHNAAKQQELLKLNKKDKKKRSDSTHGKVHQFEFHLTATSSNNAIELTATLAEELDIMLSPLSVESLERLISVAAAELTVVQPFYAIQKQFGSCSKSNHVQPLTRPLNPGKESHLTPLNIQIRCPRISALVLQCGVVEKLIAFSDLSSVAELTQTTLLSAVITNSRIVAATADHVESPKGTVEKPEDENRLLFLAETEGVFAQLVQAADTDTDIGISRNASRIPFYCDWSHIPEMQHLQPCVFMESGLHWGSLRATLNLAHNTTIHHEPATPVEQASNENSSISSPGDTTEESRMSRAVLDVGPIITNFGLLRPLEESQDVWPVYDLLAPSLSAWLHVFHRFEGVISAVQQEDRYSSELIILWLLTDALDFDTDKLISPKSKFTEAKINSDLLCACPSCQILLALLRFGRYRERKYSVTASLAGLRKRLTPQRLQMALLALLSHWQTVLCAEQSVKINSSIAQHYLEKEEKLSSEEEPAVEEKKEVAIEMDEMFSNVDSGVVSQEHSQADPTTAKIRGRHSTTGSKRRERGTTSPGGTLERGHSKEAATSATDNLYQWMKEQQKNIRTQRRTKPHMIDLTDVNPMDVPLSVYFEPFLKAHGLQGHSTAIPLLQTIGSALGFSVWLDEIKFGIVEPKLLPMIGTKSKRLGFTERPLIGFDFLNATGQLKHEFGKGGDSRDPVLRVNYHLHCKNTVCTVGLSSASFLNQISFAMKSLVETHAELSAEKQPERKLSDVTESPVKISKKARTRSTETVDGENVVDWTEKMLGILKDYQRAQRKSERFRDHSKQNIEMPVSLVVFGVVDFKLVSIQALMKELVLFITINNLQFGHSWRERRSPGTGFRKTAETSVTASVNKALMILSEGDVGLEASAPRPIHQDPRSTIINITVETSRLLFSRQLLKSGQDCENSLLVEIGPVIGDVPMHPGFLHGVVVRTSRNIQKEFERLIPPTQIVEEKELQKRKEYQTSIGQYSRVVERANPVAVISFSLSICSLKLKAQLLPSVWATYHLEGASSNGTTGSEAKFIVEVPSHNIVFCVTTEKPAASTEEQPPKPIQLDLPRLTGNGAYIHEGLAANQSEASAKDDKLIYQEGGYLKIEVEIGKFEHTLTTNLLNQILFVQEAFRREIGEIVSRITAENPSLITPSSSPRNKDPILFSLEIHGPANPPCIQITATTPTSTAIRLTIDELRGQLTNRWLHRQSKNKRERLFGSGTIHLSLVLGQFVKAATYEEVEAEFQQFAYFKTQVHMQNVETGADVPQAAMATSSYTYLINVHRPVVFIQPSAVDKAVLLWLNYKNTYEFWNEQRQQIRSRTPAVRQSSFIMSPDEAGNTPLFLKLSVDSGLHICMPLYSVQYPETNAALLVSLEKTDIAVCSLGALVSQGSFTGFCVRFAENFDAVAENWTPEEDQKAEMINSCYVPEGTYDVCSRTSAPTETCPNAEWYLNVQWKMKGVDLQLNSKIGKLTSLTITTLTSIAGEGEEESITVPGSERESSVPGFESQEQTESTDELGELASVPMGKQRTKLIEKAMNDQALTVSALKTWGATEATIEIERRKLQKLEVALFNEFRREMVEKLRRQSQKAVSLKDRFGLAVRPQSSSISMPRQHSVVDQGGFSSGRRLSEAGSKREMFRKNFRAGSLDLQAVDVMPPISAISEEDFQEDSMDVSSSSSDSNSGQDSSVRWRLPDPILPRTAAYEEQISDTAHTTVNLYLDVKIVIESGECTLRTQPKDGEGGSDSAPSSARQKSGSKLRGKGKSASNLLAPPPVTKTVIAMPSLGVSSYYASHSGPHPTSSTGMGHMRSAGLDETIISSFSKSKKAQFYMYTALESMPDETVVSPHLVDFLQETLEPIPKSQNILPWAQSLDDDVVGGKKEETSAPSSNPSGDAATLSTVSFPVDFVLYFLVQSSTIRFTSQPQSLVECLLKLPQLQILCSSRKSSDLSEPMKRHVSPVGASFHVLKDPQNEDEIMSGGISVTASLKDFSLFIFHPYGATTSTVEGPMHRRDALSLSVDSITVNISRSRNLLTALDSATDFKNSVRFSLVVAMSKACFRYDMRRLKEILSFPKAWYRRNIMRRLFLGDESASNASSDNLNAKRSGDSARSTPKPAPDSEEKSTTEKGSWEALVLYSVKCEELEVEANMGQTMGLTSWVTKDAVIQGHVDLSSRGHKDVRMALELSSSTLEAKTGVISGLIDLSQLGYHFQIKKDVGKPPHHNAGAELGKSEARIEWMSTPMFIGRSLGLSVQLEDEWLTLIGDNDSVDQSQVFVNGKIRWKELQIMITKSTVNDLIRIFNKLTEFFEQQVKRGRQVLFYPSLKEQKAAASSDAEVVLKHHHHWQLPLQIITDIQLTLNFFPLPRLSTVVGGSLDLSGEEITLSCFHGANFRAPTWALFYMKEPAITFLADARDVVMSPEDIGTLVSQSLKFRLGSEYSVRRGNQTMSIIARVQQGRYMPPSPGTIEELLNYAQGSVLKQVFGTESKDHGKYPHSVVQLFRMPAFELELRTGQRQADEEPSDLNNRPVVNCIFVAEFHDHLFVSSNVEALYFLHELINAYMQEKQSSVSSSRTSSTSGDPKGRIGHPMEELQLDGRDYHCETWVLEPTVRFIEVGPYEPFGVDYILQKLGFRHARTTIPKWMQRGFMDPLDGLLAILVEKTLTLAKKSS